MISSVTAQPCYRVCLFFYQLLPNLIALEFLIKQPARTPPFLRNLVASPVRHAELEHDDHWHYTVDRKQHRHIIHHFKGNLLEI